MGGAGGGVAGASGAAEEGWGGKEGEVAAGFKAVEKAGVLSVFCTKSAGFGGKFELKSSDIHGRG